MKRTRFLKTISWLLPLFLLIACGGKSDSPSLSELMDKNGDKGGEIDCNEMSVDDFDGFLGIYESTEEASFKDIIPGVAHGEYTEDSTVFQYIFDDIEDVSTYINVDAASGNVLFYNLLLDSQSKKELENTQKRMMENYDIDKCHSQFFMMSQDEIEKIMGDDNFTHELESGDYWLEYDDDSSGRSVHFYFPTDNALGCIMIRVVYS